VLTIRLTIRRFVGEEMGLGRLRSDDTLVRGVRHDAMDMGFVVEYILSCAAFVSIVFRITTTFKRISFHQCN
jgi:hypothetical protein